MKTIILVTTLVPGLVHSLSAENNPGPEGIDTATWQAGHAEVRRLRGTAQFCTNGTHWNALDKGMIFHPGTLVKTAAKSTLDLSLGEDIGSVQVRPDSQLGLDKMRRASGRDTARHETTLDLTQGNVVIRVNRMSKDSTFKVKLLNGVASVEGSLPIGVSGARPTRETTARLSADGIVCLLAPRKDSAAAPTSFCTGEVAF